MTAGFRLIYRQDRPQAAAGWTYHTPATPASCPRHSRTHPRHSRVGGNPSPPGRSRLDSTSFPHPPPSFPRRRESIHAPTSFLHPPTSFPRRRESRPRGFRFLLRHDGWGTAALQAVRPIAQQWIPAFAGMTYTQASPPVTRRLRGRVSGRTGRRRRLRRWPLRALPR